MFERHRPWLRTALAATAVAVATATGAATAVAAPEADPVAPPSFQLYGVEKQTHWLWNWFYRGQLLSSDGPDFVDHSDLADLIPVLNPDVDGYGYGKWTLYKNGRLDFDGRIDGEYRWPENVGRGWDIYRTVLSPGSIGGAEEADLLGVDKAGVLWSYLGYPDGRLTTRMRVGGGWGQYTELAGQSDLTGDGRADITARDKAGVLWLYKGTGDYKAPFAGRTKIGGGWNAYDRLLAVGDDDGDGKADLLARKTTGELVRYPGTGNAARPFKAPVRIPGGSNMKNFILF
ncbi:FG-GAP-like repeat-containing protein [Streptomyces sp. NPDC056264]|uniref:FG-GAP-like repeat-containing protein n=1 Tax=Streptomyces sp. NPDC056264 TaxID=3345767 RepID=UPI003AAA452C